MNFVEIMAFLPIGIELYIPLHIVNFLIKLRFNEKWYRKIL